MSGLVGAASPDVALVPVDNRLLAQEFSDDGLGGALFVDLYTCDDSVILDSEWMSSHWPSRGAMIGDGGLADVPFAVWHNYPYPVSGAQYGLGYVGYSRDQYGTPVPNCTIRCFRTSTGALVYTTTSDANGLFRVVTPYLEAHFLTIHNNTVSPPIAGASVDTLTPS